MFELENFIESCRAAVQDADGHKAVRELAKEAIEDHQGLAKELGTPERGALEKLYVGDDLTVLHLAWAPRMVLRPHNHKMWAVIGIYEGREDNMFWRELPEDADGRIEAAGAKTIAKGDVVPLGKDIIHSVVNPTDKLTCALHIYGGNFFEAHRNEWEPEGLTKQTYSVENTIRAFEEANRVLD